MRRFGGNSGYVGYSMSRRAAEARHEGRYPKTDFKKYYCISEKALKLLIELGYISNNEWHHTSKFGNPTTFYGWNKDYYADAYYNNKKEIDAIAREKYCGSTELRRLDKIRIDARKEELQYLQDHYAHWIGDSDDIANTDEAFFELRKATERATEKWLEALNKKTYKWSAIEVVRLEELMHSADPDDDD